MDAVVRPLQDPYSPINIQVQVFRDDEQVQNVVGETRPVRADIEAGDELRIRVTCELSSPTVILTDATVTAA